MQKGIENMLSNFIFSVLLWKETMSNIKYTVYTTETLNYDYTTLQIMKQIQSLRLHLKRVFHREDYINAGVVHIPNQPEWSRS